LPSLSRSRTFLAAGIGVFLLSSLAIFFLTADLFHPALDEGIYLEGGHRILLGQAPYRDFFAYTGPLIYWVQAGLEAAFGPEMRMLRLSTVLSVGLTCFGTFWMAERFVGWKPSVGAALVFLAMRMPSYQHFAVSHRWVSTSLMTVAIAAVLDAIRPEHPARRASLGFALAGALAAAAAWTTPPFLLPLLVIAVWLAVHRQWRQIALVAAGMLAVSVPAILVLARQGALLPMLDKLVWASRQYSVANRVPFGYYPVAFKATHEAVGAVNWLFAWLKDVRLAIPTALIPAALAVGFIQMVRGRWKGPAALLVWLALAMTLTTWPRWDVNLLIGVTPPCYVILTIWCEELARSPRKAVQMAVLTAYILTITLSFAYAADLFTTVDSFTYFPTRLGLLRNIAEDGDAYGALEQRIPQGATLFVFPYLPSIGFALQTRNPISYCYLQPGMMSRADEAQALAELEAHPPRFILRQYFPDRQILNVWPNSDRSLMRYPSIEHFIEQRYTNVDKVQSPHFQLTVYELH
jgi:hypothetical protein